MQTDSFVDATVQASLHFCALQNSKNYHPTTEKLYYERKFYSSKVLLSSNSNNDNDQQERKSVSVVMAWTLVSQLTLVLRREELEWADDDATKTKKIQQMTRWLNTRLLYGCTALEYLSSVTVNEIKPHSNLLCDDEGIILTRSDETTTANDTEYLSPVFENIGRALEI